MQRPSSRLHSILHLEKLTGDVVLVVSCRGPCRFNQTRRMSLLYMIPEGQYQSGCSNRRNQTPGFTKTSANIIICQNYFCVQIQLPCSSCWMDCPWLVVFYIYAPAGLVVSFAWRRGRLRYQFISESERKSLAGLLPFRPGT